MGYVSTIGAGLGSTKLYAQPAGFVPGTSYFTLGAPAGVVAVPDTMLPGTPTLAIGGASSVTNGGYLAVIEPNFVAAGTPVAGLTSVSVDGRIVTAVSIKDAATNEPVETPTGEEVFGLLQAWDDATTIDGVAVAANPNENTQISFVYYSKVPGPPPAPAVTAYSLPAGTYYFAPNIHTTLASTSYSVLLGGDAPLPDVMTRVYYVATFAGVAYTAYPQGSIVVALDTDEVRNVGSTRWHYVRGSRIETRTGAAATATLTDSDGVETLLVDCAGADRTPELPVAANNTGRIITVVKIDAGADNVILEGNGAETISGGANVIWNAQWSARTVQSNGTFWVLI